jgi:hypothetical protein
MQKVEGSSPFSRFGKCPANRGVFSFWSGWQVAVKGRGYHSRVPNGRQSGTLGSPVKKPQTGSGETNVDSALRSWFAQSAERC